MPKTRPSSGLTEDDLRPPADFIEEKTVSTFGDWISDFIPDDNAPPHKMRSWRKRLALVACSNWMFTFSLLTPFLVAALFFGLPILGRVVYAGELDNKIETKISAALDPLAKEQKRLAETQEKQGRDMRSQGEILRSLATASLRTEICRYATRRLLEHDVNERGRLLDQIIDMRNKYKEYSGQEFNTADC